MSQADIGLIGLAVMGQNLVMNMNDHGFRVAVYNRSEEKTKDFLSGSAKNSEVVGSTSIAQLCSQLKSPKVIMIMVKAGAAVDAVINELIPHLSPEDTIIDGGNSLYTDSERRTQELASKGLYFIGMGVSGGEEGARYGPSLMPGGNQDGWETIKPIFQSISAKVDGEPCCEWMGSGGAGHYVKMVHNGIEYGDMQLICEAYHLMRSGLDMPVGTIQSVFKQWQTGVLDSYLIEITGEILGVKDSDGAPLVDKILDTAGQKGTGKWTGISALENGIPLTLIGEAVFARYLSALKDQRKIASSLLSGPSLPPDQNPAKLTQAIHDALYASKIISYAQGFMLLTQASNDLKWSLNFGNIASVWRGGCIIRSRFLKNIKQAYTQMPDLENLLLDTFFKDAVENAQDGWRIAIQYAVSAGIPAPAFSSALAFYDGYRSERLPANLLQAQRDYFGAHTYERTDRPRGEFFHTQWTKDS